MGLAARVRANLVTLRCTPRDMFTLRLLCKCHTFVLILVHRRDSFPLTVAFRHLKEAQNLPEVPRGLHFRFAELDRSVLAVHCKWD